MIDFTAYLIIALYFVVPALIFRWVYKYDQECKAKNREAAQRRDYAEQCKRQADEEFRRDIQRRKESPEYQRVQNLCRMSDEEYKRHIDDGRVARGLKPLYR